MTQSPRKLSPSQAFAHVLFLVSDECKGDESDAIRGAKQHVSRLRRRVRALTEMLLEVQEKHYHEPDSDARIARAAAGAPTTSPRMTRTASFRVSPILLGRRWDGGERRPL
jgi:hypothetical protein